VICKDCKPVYYKQAELTHPPTDYVPADTVVFKHVEFCPLHEAEAATGTLIAMAEEDRAERRRYALLQAAATILSGFYTDPTMFWNEEAVVNDAISLLAEIEKREKEPKP